VEVVLGGISSLLYGVADFLGGEGAKRAPAAAVVLWAGVLSFPLILVVALIVGGQAAFSDYLLGMAAGTAGAVGLVSLFAGLGRGQAAAVAPTAAAVAAVLPVVVAVFEGERPTALAWAGVVVAIPAIVLCAWVADPGESLKGSVGYGLAAGFGFGGFTAIIGLTDPESNLLPLIASRAATMGVVVLLTAFGVWKLVRFGSSPRLLVAGNALLDVSGNVALLLAVRAGSVAASFYPAVTVLLAKLVNGEHLRARQISGIVLTVIAMSAIALG
jgi:drug/metabolite transporter (DMT)-like permease